MPRFAAPTQSSQNKTFNAEEEFQHQQQRKSASRKRNCSEYTSNSPKNTRNIRLGGAGPEVYELLNYGSKNGGQQDMFDKTLNSTKLDATTNKSKANTTTAGGSIVERLHSEAQQKIDYKAHVEELKLLNELKDCTF